MAVPVTTESFGFSHDIAHDITTDTFQRLKVFGPFGEVGQVERNAIGFSENVQINVIVREEIRANEWPNTAHRLDYLKTRITFNAV